MNVEEILRQLKNGTLEQYVLYLTKEKLRESGFSALWQPEEEWWETVPDVIEVTVTYDEWSDEYIFRYCFDYGRGSHMNDYYEYHDEEDAKAILGELLEEAEA